MTYTQLLDRVISDGIAAARADYADKPHKLRGAVDGFEACRGKTPKELIQLWKKAEAEARVVRQADGDTEGNINTYWYWRCFNAEVEFVLNVVSVGVVQQGGAPLLGWLPTYRGAMKYAEIVGVRGGGESAS